MSYNDNRWTYIFDSGAVQGVNLLTDSFGNLTYASWQQDMAIPFNVRNPDEYVVGLTKCVYRTPSGNIPSSENKGRSMSNFLRKPIDPLKIVMEEGDDDDVLINRLEGNIEATENGTSSVYVYINFVGTTSIGGEGQRIIASIPPPSIIDSSGSVKLVAAGSWPLSYVQTSTVVPWVPLSAGSFSQAIITFASSNGTIIPTHDLATAAPFNITLVIRKKSEISSFI
jgi:hypothetical protein